MNIHIRALKFFILGLLFIGIVLGTLLVIGIIFFHSTIGGIAAVLVVSTLMAAYTSAAIL